MRAATYRLVRLQSVKTKNPMPKSMGRKIHRWDRQHKLAGHIPNRVSLSIKEVSIMCSGCGSPHRGHNPSSVTQLPILTALHARSPTLFFLIIHEGRKKVNSVSFFFQFWLKLTEAGDESAEMERNGGLHQKFCSF